MVRPFEIQDRHHRGRLQVLQREHLLAEFYQSHGEVEVRDTGLVVIDYSEGLDWDGLGWAGLGFGVYDL